MTRLDLLLGDRSALGNHGNHSSLMSLNKTPNLPEDNSFPSFSSMGSGEATPDRGICDTSPVSTLTTGIYLFIELNRDLC